MRRRRPLAAAMVAALTAGLVMVSGSPVAAVAPADGVVFVNEIHYDNDGTDAGEAIEIAGPAGTDLTGWSLVLYNGSGGALYDTTAAERGHPRPVGRVRRRSASLSVQRHPERVDPDGVALVDPAGAVAQFLSYEGTFTATGGPAAGLDEHRHRCGRGSSHPGRVVAWPHRHR